jgi:hypothetical protein
MLYRLSYAHHTIDQSSLASSSLSFHLGSVCNRSREATIRTEFWSCAAGQNLEASPPEPNGNTRGDRTMVRDSFGSVAGPPKLNGSDAQSVAAVAETTPVQLSF